MLTVQSEFLTQIREVLISVQLYIETKLGPFMKGLAAVAMLIYVMSLVFSFEELFGATPEEELIKLT